MIEFSRRRLEDKLAHEQQEDLRELTEDEVDLEVCASQTMRVLYVIMWFHKHSHVLTPHMSLYIVRFPHMF